tara:strand:+ start:37410 stop:37715 length:306 start_codon:yes stop_codon:yes gene_type:complete
MLEFDFKNNGSIVYDIEIKDRGAKIRFYGKNYNTNTDDYVIIENIYYKDLILPELLEFSKMTTDNKDYKELTNVNYISFNGIWEIKFTDNDLKQILKKKLT